MLTDIHSFMRAVERMVGATGIKVEWIDEGKTPYTDMVRGTVYLPRPPLGASMHDQRMLRAYGWHETGHHHKSHKNCIHYVADGRVPNGSVMARVHNAVVDVINEYVQSAEYPGAAEDLDYAQAWFARQTNDAARNPKAKFEDPFLARVMALIYTARGEWQPSVALAAAGIGDHLDISCWTSLIPRR
jgi:hypothetical protein